MAASDPRTGASSPATVGKSTSRGSDRHTASMEGPVPTFHITVRGADREAMADLVRTHRVRVLPQTLDEEGPEPRVDALADEPTIRRLADAGYRVERHEDVAEAAREDLEQVGRGNRFAAELATATEAEKERS
jgi:hypothetical protein